MPELAETYFRSEKYNDFPVVNIPAFGASLFCEWLEKETKIYAKCIKKSYREFTLRIPSDAEWMNLVYYGITQIPPGDNFLTILDINEGYIDKALDKRIKSIQKSYKSKDIEDKLYATGRYGMSQEQVTEIFSNAWKLHETQPTDTIFPKRMKDFCLIGHVSEVITELNTGNNIVFGTIWKNKQEFSEMMNKYKSDGCSPFVGMRFVKLYEDAADYKNPFW